MDAEQGAQHHVAGTVPISLGSLFWIFFRIAWTSFGGFMTMISVVQDAVVERRKLLSQHDMLDGISLASILPGPVAVNVVAYVGYRLRGASGAFIAAFASILPAFVIFLGFSLAYFRWGHIPAVGKVFMGFVPAVTAIIAGAVWNMGRKSIAGVREGLLAFAAAAALVGIGGFFSTLGIILVAGVIGWLWFREPQAKSAPGAAPDGKSGPASEVKKAAGSGSAAHLLLLAGGPGAIGPFLSFDPSLVLKVFMTFASMSLFLFGGAYVFIPLIQEIVVDGHHWVTHQEFIDAVAMGQVTPGPVLVSAAFIGLKVAGLAGAVAATAGIFVPSAIVMILCSRLLERIKKSAIVKAALRGIRPAVVGMIAAAVVSVAKTAAPVWLSAAIFAAALIALLRFRVEAVWIIPAAGAVGFFAY
jgi:chromate transporter